MPMIRALARFFGVAALALLLSPAAGAADDEMSLADIVEAWLAAPHGNYHSRSFTYWNDDGAVPEACAACHSEPGFIDYLGADGSTPFHVDRPAAINSPIGCASCHTATAHALDSVPFPSGTTVDGLGASAVCSVCHQGRQSGVAVTSATEGLDQDEVSAELTFINVHYGVAAAVMHGSVVHGGFQYPDRTYAGRFAHVPSASTCTACHDAHSTRVETQGCLSCHQGVEDIRAIRMRHADFDGDGETHGGIHGEIMGLHEQLYQAIQTYAAEVSGTPIGYAGQFPYFFNDTDGDGQISSEEATMANRYASWTPRLLKAAYNYQFVAKDPGAYTHNPTYAMQVLYDSLESLSARTDVDMATLVRP
jgi:hypothetical protein